MRKKLILTSLCGLAASGVMQADITDSDLYLFLGGTSSVTSVSTSMHDAGSAAASYTLGSGGGNSSARTTSSGNSAAYAKSKHDSPSSTGSSASAGYSSSDSVKGGLGSKAVIPTEADDPSPFIIAVDGGYQSQYIYNGVNRIRLAAYDDVSGFGFSEDDFDSYYLGASVKWKGISAGVKYIRSVDSNLNPMFNSNPAYQSEYSEYVVDLNYTLGLIAGPQGSGNWLDATVGYEFTYFPEDTFWNTDMQHKFYAVLKMNRYNWLRPSVAYHSIEAGSINSVPGQAPGLDILSGEQLIFQVDGGDVVYSTSSVEVSVAYYAKAGLASGYTNSYGNAAIDTVSDEVLNSDWYQAGINIPISFDNITVTPSVHYTDNEGSAIEEPGFWWGINAQYTF